MYAIARCSSYLRPCLCHILHREPSVWASFKAMLLLVLASCSVMARLILLGGDMGNAEATLQTLARLCRGESIVWLVVGRRQVAIVH